MRCFYMFFSLVRLDYAENTIKPCDLIIGIGLKPEDYITDNKVNIRNYGNIHWCFSFKFY